jgi:hypothetical protein
MRSGRRATSALAAGRLRRRLRWSVSQPVRSLRRCSFWSLSALLLSWPSAGFASDFDLMGSWYVLIHYRDEAANNPEVDRWEDRVWVFGKKGSRLSWTEYPVVMFSDRRGRFERTLSGATRRVLEAWEPNEAQLGEIRAGLEASVRGSRSKTLKGSPSRGYRSAGNLRSQGVSVIGYHETWSIEGLPDRPTFIRDDLMGSGRTATMEGRTEYAGSEVGENGSLIRGSYERDGTRHGVFRMMRAGEVVKDESKKKKQATRRPYLSVFDSPQDKRDIGSLASLGSDASDQDLAELRKQLRQTIERTLRGVGFEGPLLEQRTESLAVQVEMLLLEQAMTVDEVEAMVLEGKIQP